MSSSEMKIILPRADDVEEIPCENDEVPVKPERDFQPPRVNTFFNNESGDSSGKQATHGGNSSSKVTAQAAAASSSNNNRNH